MSSLLIPQAFVGQFLEHENKNNQQWFISSVLKVIQKGSSTIITRKLRSKSQEDQTANLRQELISVIDSLFLRINQNFQKAVLFNNDTISSINNRLKESSLPDTSTTDSNRPKRNCNSTTNLTPAKIAKKEITLPVSSKPSNAKSTIRTRSSTRAESPVRMFDIPLPVFTPVESLPPKTISNIVAEPTPNSSLEVETVSDDGINQLNDSDLNTNLKLKTCVKKPIKKSKHETAGTQLKQKEIVTKQTKKESDEGEENVAIVPDVAEEIEFTELETIKITCEDLLVPLDTENASSSSFVLLKPPEQYNIEQQPQQLILHHIKKDTIDSPNIATVTFDSANITTMPIDQENITTISIDQANITEIPIDSTGITSMSIDSGNIIIASNENGAINSKPIVTEYLNEMTQAIASIDGTFQLVSFDANSIQSHENSEFTIMHVDANQIDSTTMALNDSQASSDENQQQQQSMMNEQKRAVLFELNYAKLLLELENDDEVITAEEHDYTLQAPKRMRTGNSLGERSEPSPPEEDDDAIEAMDDGDTTSGKRRGQSIVKHRVVVISLQCFIGNCSKSFSNKAELSEHLKNIHYVEKKMCFVSGCNQSFVTNALLNKHRKERHSGMSSYECAVCHLSYNNYQNMQKHRIDTHHLGLFKCSHSADCDFTAESRTKLRLHVIGKHRNPFPCRFAFCDKAYSTLIARNDHEFAHMHLAPYRCTVCNYQSSMLNYVLRHIIFRHLGIKKAQIGRNGRTSREKPRFYKEARQYFEIHDRMRQDAAVWIQARLRRNEPIIWIPVQEETTEAVISPPQETEEEVIYEETTEHSEIQEQIQNSTC